MNRGFRVTRLQVKKSTLLKRAKDFNQENLPFFDLLENMFAIIKSQSSLSTNMDTSGFSTLQKNTQKVLGKGTLQVDSEA